MIRGYLKSSQWGYLRSLCFLSLARIAPPSLCRLTNRLSSRTSLIRVLWSIMHCCTPCYIKTKQRSSYWGEGNLNFQGPNNKMKNQSKASVQVPVQYLSCGAPRACWLLSGAGWRPHADRRQMGRVSAEQKMWLSSEKADRHGQMETVNIIMWRPHLM